MKNYTITINGNVYSVTVEEGNGENVAKASNNQAAAPVASGKAGSYAIKAQLGGQVKSIKAPVGTVVKRGQVILTFEAMKMENELVAEQDGTVASINVAVGDKFETGAIIVTLN